MCLKGLKFTLSYKFKKIFFSIKWCTIGICYQRNNLKCIKALYTFQTYVGNMNKERHILSCLVDMQKAREVWIQMHTVSEDFKD